MNVTMTSEVIAKLRALLNEESDDACIRVREAKIGAGWKSQIVLRLSISEREDDDVEGEIESLPFVINSELVDQYGLIFSVSLDEHQNFDVKAMN